MVGCARPVAVIALAGSFWLVRRQALKDAELFWSPPTRRIMQALLPPLVAGSILSAVVFGEVNSLSSAESFGWPL